MFFVVNERAQARESSFFVFRLISCFSTFDEYFLNHPCIRVLPVITQTNTGFDFIYILSSGTTGTESIPFDFAFMYLYVKLLRFRKHRHCCCRSVYASLRLSGRYPLHTMHTAFIFHGSVNIRPGQVEHNLFVSAGSTFGYRGYGKLPAFSLGIFLVHAEKVASEKSRLVTTGSPPYLHNGVFRIIRICRYQKKFYFFLQFRDSGGCTVKFFSCKCFHFIVVFHG